MNIKRHLSNAKRFKAYTWSLSDSTQIVLHFCGEITFLSEQIQILCRKNDKCMASSLVHEYQLLVLAASSIIGCIKRFFSHWSLTPSPSFPSQSQTIWSNQVCTWHFLSYLSTSQRSLSHYNYLDNFGCIKRVSSHESIVLVITSLSKVTFNSPDIRT